jgi:hypothetical protein
MPTESKPQAMRSTLTARQGQATSVPVRMLSGFAGPVQLPQAAAKGFNLLLVRVLLPLGQLQGLQHFFHLFQGTAEGLDDVVDLFNGLLDGGR